MSRIFSGDDWLHIGGLIAIAIGLADSWYFHAWGNTTDLLFVVGGVAGLGLRIINGSAAVIRNGLDKGGDPHA